jgi:CBS domain-containing protein
MLDYTAIEIFTSEEARMDKKPLADAVPQYVRDLKIAARCIVTRGIAGCYESGEITTGRLEVLSFNLPIRIYILVPAAESERVLNGLSGRIRDGIVAVHHLNVVSHHVHNAFFPRQLLVRDVMTSAVRSVSLSSPLSEAAKLLLSSVFSGLPVVDDKNRPVGVITQGDLIEKGGLPLRLGLLAEFDSGQVETILEKMASKKASEAMTASPVVIRADRLLMEAVDTMLGKGVKRLPVVDPDGRLVGMLSRLDIFRTVMREAPDWNSFRAQKIEVGQLKRVKDILRRDAYSVSPQTAVNKVMRMIDRNDIQRVAVVDEDGKLLGLISDRDLLRYFKQEKSGFQVLLDRIKRPFKPGSPEGADEASAANVMNADLITVHEDMRIEEALGLMTEKALKRLPVIDHEGRFKGMISRDSLLRTGFGWVKR